jgi:hypothetical protein
MGEVCDRCESALIEIDRCGEMLVGCIDCNRWGKPADKNLVMELLEDGLEDSERAEAANRRIIRKAYRQFSR